MTKKDYIAIAKAFNKVYTKPSGFKTENESCIEEVLYYLIPYFKQDNPNFDKDKFKEACGV